MSNLRPMNDQVLLELEPEPEHYSGVDVKLFKVGDKDSHVFRVGKVLAVGPGQWAERNGEPLGHRVPIGIEVGARVLFVKYVATHTQSAMSIQHTIGKDRALVKSQDLLFEVTDDFDIGSLSQ